MAGATLGAVGTAVGTALGGPIGGVVGGIVGGTLGGEIDRRVFGRDTLTEGPRLPGVSGMSSTEGAPLPRVYGRAAVDGVLIWYAHLREIVTESSQAQGGKGSAPKDTTRTFSYTLSFAVSLGQGPIDGVGRIWADGVEIDRAKVLPTIYLGTEAQTADTIMEGLDGSDNAPGYRGTAYLVFTDFDVTSTNGRVPQIRAEVFRYRVRPPFKGACILPGSGDFALDTVAQDVVTTSAGGSVVSRAPINRSQDTSRADALLALDQLERDLPNVETVLIVLGWFFDDLRCASANVRPKVDIANKVTSPGSWTVSGVTRSGAAVVSQSGGAPAYGATPDDASVYRIVQECRDRGFKVIIYPFLFGDIAAGNGLPDPYSNSAAGSGQAVYPWRGRITVSPAAGFTGTVDKTATAATQVATFFGTAATSEFGAWNGSTIPFTGSGFGLRRMVLHYAKLASEAWGATDRDKLMICIGSELRTLTQARSGASTYPAVAQMVTLAGDVRTIMGATPKITYAADWSEYFGHQPADGSGDVFFHLDPLWSDADIDFVAIDNYMPLADINPEIADASGAGEDRRALQYDATYLRDGVEGGEYWDYFYADDAARASRTRTAITDGGGKPWVFRAKGLRDWLGNLHYDRPGGTESGTPTAWAADMKSAIFTEFGCAALDLSANQPNVFIDPKSSESFYPHFSSGARDDAAQRAFNGAFWAEWTAIGGSQIDLTWSCIWAWDFRPYPAFPNLVAKWADGPNWREGFWLTGRAASLSLGELIDFIAADFGVSIDATETVGAVDGYVIDRPMSFRDAMEPALRAFATDIADDGATLRARSRALLAPAATLVLDDLAVGAADGPRAIVTRPASETLPQQVRVSYISGEDGDYRTGQQIVTRAAGGAGVMDVALPAIVPHQTAMDAAARISRDLHLGQETIAGAVAPPQLALTVGDVATIDGADWQITRLSGGLTRQFDARRVDLEALQPGRVSGAGAIAEPQPVLAPTLIFLDLPQMDPRVEDHRGYVAAVANPFPARGVAVYRSPGVDGFALALTVPFGAQVGETTTTLVSDRADVWSDAVLGVEMYSGTLASASDVAVLSGANALAIETSAGWEIVQFASATMTAPRTYDLTRLLRARRGTDCEMVASLAAGARVVMLDGRVAPVPMARSDVGLAFNWRFGPAGRALSDATFSTVAHAFTGRGMKPLAPAQFTATANAGDIDLTWRRRSRVRFDPMRAGDPPLAEESERYTVTIRDGATALRTIATTTTAATYTAAQQSADGGVATHADVAQIGTGGRVGCAATISI